MVNNVDAEKNALPILLLKKRLSIPLFPCACQLAIAQLVERLTVEESIDQSVPGSIPGCEKNFCGF